MKRMMVIGSALLCVVLASGCGRSPRSVSKTFCENLAAGQLSDAKKDATEQAGQFLDMAASFGSLPTDPDFTFIFVEQSVDGNRAEVKYREEPNGEVQSIDLVKLDGEWKVHIEKDE